MKDREYMHCIKCSHNIHRDCTGLQEINDIVIITCPVCGAILDAQAKSAPLAYSDYLPTVDQCTYTIHCLQKQEAKLSNALKQIHDTITKLDILREIAKEKEQN